jgi:hypothetical protein
MQEHILAIEAEACAAGSGRDNNDAGSGLGSTTGSSGLKPAPDASTELELRDASAASNPTVDHDDAFEARAAGSGGLDVAQLGAAMEAACDALSVSSLSPGDAPVLYARLAASDPQEGPA